MSIVLDLTMIPPLRNLIPCTYYKTRNQCRDLVRFSQDDFTIADIETTLALASDLPKYTPMHMQLSIKRLPSTPKYCDSLP